MRILQQRYFDSGESTLSLLWVLPPVVPPLRQPHEWLCYTLEDTYREHKVPGETRVPASPPEGYRVRFHPGSRFDPEYRARYPFHRGMLWLSDVANFDGILFHAGNTAKDTRGCVLPGLTAGGNVVGSSRDAYVKVYQKVAPAVAAGVDVRWVIRDEPGRF